jgi:histidine triad (HIT) family protein
MTPTCIFCKIVAGEISATIVHKDEHVTAFRDIHPAAPTHILIIPNKHIESIHAATREDQALIGHLFLAAQQLAEKENLAPNGYRLVTNIGADAGQSVFHLHVHLLGGRKMSWPPG